MSEFTQQEILTEAQCIYDAVSDSAMENGREMPWWGELPDEVVETYLDRAKAKLVKRSEAYAKLESLRESDVVEWLQDKGYDVAKYE